MPDQLVADARDRGAAAAPRTTRWAFEIKWDGVRAICHAEPGRLRFARATCNDVTSRYPELGPLNARAGPPPAMLDGEVVAFDEEGRPSFERAAAADAPGRRERRSGGWPSDSPVTYVVFDLLWLDGVLADGPALRRAPRDPRGPRADGDALAASRPTSSATAGGAAGRDARAGPGGRRRQAAGLAVRAGAAQSALGQGQELVKRQELRDRRLDPRGGQAPRTGSARCWSGSATTTARCATSGASAPASPRPSSTASPSCLAPLRRDDVAVRRRRRRSRARRSSSSRARLRGRVHRVDARGRAARAVLQGAARGQGAGRAPSCAKRPARPSLVEVDGRELRLSNLDKVLYPADRVHQARPASPTTLAIAPRAARAPARPPADAQALPQRRRGQVLLREERAVAPPDWVATATLGSAATSSPTDAADAGLAGATSPTSSCTRRWRARSTPERPDDGRLRPRPRRAGAACPSAATVALWLHGDARGPGPASRFPKTSGSKGMQVYVPLNDPRSTYAQTKAFAQGGRRAAGARGARARRRAADQGPAQGQGARRLEPERRSTRRRSASTRRGRASGRRCRRR